LRFDGLRLVHLFEMKPTENISQEKIQMGREQKVYAGRK
jgi:hypothetical protein